MRMKKSLFHAAACLLFAMCCSSLSGCKDGEEILVTPGTASVALERLKVGTDSFSVQATPSDEALRWEYAIGSEGDRAAFMQGTLEGIRSEQGSEVRQLTFTGLDADCGYTLFARAYDPIDRPGAVASLRVTTFREGFTIESQYLTSRSAGFVVICEPDWCSFRYAIARAEDRQRFIDGILDDETIDEKPTWVINCFDLEPQSDYVLYVQPYDRLGMPGELHEIEVTTYASDQCPGVEASVTRIDVYSGTYRVVPNERCGSFNAVVFPSYTIGEVVPPGYAGSIMDFMVNHVGDGTLGHSGRKTIEFDYITSDLEPELELDFYVLVFDEDSEPWGVYKFPASTPGYDQKAGEATCSITLSDITAAGATCTYTANEQTLGVFFEILEADWWDGFIQTDDYFEGWLLQYFHYSGYWKHLGSGGNFTYTEAKAKADTRYYAAAIPINANGIQGSGPVVLEEFTTLAE